MMDEMKGEREREVSHDAEDVGLSNWAKGEATY